MEIDGFIRKDATVDRRLGEKIERGAITLGSKNRLESLLVVIQIHVSPDAQQTALVHHFDIVDCRLAPAFPSQVLVKAVEELLDMMGYATAQAATHLMSDVCWEVRL